MRATRLWGIPLYGAGFDRSKPNQSNQWVAVMFNFKLLLLQTRMINYVTCGNANMYLKFNKGNYWCSMKRMALTRRKKVRRLQVEQLWCTPRQKQLVKERKGTWKHYARIGEWGGENVKVRIDHWKRKQCHDLVTVQFRHENQGKRRDLNSFY